MAVQPLAPRSHPRVSSQRRPRRRPRRIRRMGMALVTFLVLTGAFIGIRWVRGNVATYAAASHRLRTLWSTQIVKGLPPSQLAAVRSRYQHLAKARVGPMPASWLGTFGPDPHILSLLQSETLHTYTQYFRQQHASATQAGHHLTTLEAPWHGLSQAAVSQAVGQAKSPRALQQLTTEWRLAASQWSRSEQQLAHISGGLTHAHPLDIEQAMASLRDRFQAAPVWWRGRSQAQAALNLGQHYLTLPIATQILQHATVLQALQEAQRGLVAPNPSPFNARVRTYLAQRSGVFAAAVYNAATGKIFTLNGQAHFDTASIVKVTIMATLLWQAQSAHRPLTPQEQTLMVPMIEDSSNSAASSLWNLAGRSAGIAKFLHAAGMTATMPGRGGFWGLTQTTAGDQVQLMRLLAYSNPILTNASRTYALNLMQRITPWEAWGVSHGPTLGAQVALKNGWLPVAQQGWEINSIGRVAAQSRQYVVAILSFHAPTEAYGIATVNHLSQMIWEGLGHTPPT